MISTMFWTMLVPLLMCGTSLGFYTSFSTSSGWSPGDCGSSEFRCDGGMCVPAVQECDGSDDCPDGSDEVKCPAGPDVLPKPAGGVDCNADQFRCNSGQCIPDPHWCDGLHDCDDETDETDPMCPI